MPENDDNLNSEKTFGRGDTPADAKHQPSLNPGDTLGQYKIIRLLGRGGMGEVYEVEHTTLEKHFALKLLPSDFGQNKNALQRFRREAKFMAHLDHPQIFNVDKFGEDEGPLLVAHGTPGISPSKMTKR